MFFYTPLTSLTLRKPETNCKFQGPMSNVLHNTPAKKLHQTLTLIYPSIIYPWFRCSGTWTNKTRKVRRWGYRLGGENSTEVCEHIFKNNFAFWFYILDNASVSSQFILYRASHIILDYLQALMPKYDLIWCGTPNFVSFIKKFILILPWLRQHKLILCSFYLL